MGGLGRFGVVLSWSCLGIIRVELDQSNNIFLKHFRWHLEESADRTLEKF